MGISCDNIAIKEDQKKSGNIKLKDVISTNIFKIIVGNLYENRKLNIIKYSKYFQKQLSINIEYYKKISGKYKIDGINGPGKEYSLNTNVLIFEGEYLKGKRNGNGKEYYENGTKKFEGEYANGKRNGKGKEYNANGYLLFEGECLNDKKWNGNFNKKQLNPKKKDNDDEVVVYKLENGKGIVKEYEEDRLVFEGEYLKGERNGKGKEYFHYGDIEYRGFYRGTIYYEGEYLDGKKWNGKGYYHELIYEIENGKGNIKEYNRYGKLILECEILNGEKNGKCKEYINETLVFEGEYRNGKKWSGKEYCDDQLIFEGEYLNGKMWNGKCKIYITSDILQFEGELFNGKKWNGKGYDKKGNIIYEIKNGKGNLKEIKEGSQKIIIVYDKEYSNEEKKRKGKEYDWNHKLMYEGEFLDDIRNGKGKEYNEEDRLVYDGEYLNGEKNGKGKGYDEYNGELIFDGEYKGGKFFNGKGKGYLDGGMFEGEYLNGKMWNGKIIYNAKPKIVNKLKNGAGYIKEYDDTDYLKFEGEYKNGERNGKGKEYNYREELIYEGEYKDGYRSKGKEYDGDSGQLRYDGEYLNGEKNGKGKYYDCNGNLEFDGEYKNGGNGME